MTWQPSTNRISLLQNDRRHFLINKFFFLKGHIRNLGSVARIHKIVLYIIKGQQIHKIYSIWWKRKNIANNCKVRSRNNKTPKNSVCVYIVEILGCEKDDMNKEKWFRWNSNAFFFVFLFTLLLGKRLHKMQIYPLKKKRRKIKCKFYLFFFLHFLKKLRKKIQIWSSFFIFFYLSFLFKFYP